MNEKEKNRIDAAAMELIYDQFKDACERGKEYNFIGEAFYTVGVCELAEALKGEDDGK